MEKKVERSKEKRANRELRGRRQKNNLRAASERYKKGKEPFQVERDTRE